MFLRDLTVLPPHLHLHTLISDSVSRWPYWIYLLSRYLLFEKITGSHREFDVNAVILPKRYRCAYIFLIKAIILLVVVFVLQGMKVSCTHFQCAAWAFQHLRDHFDSNSSPDMNHHLLTFQSNIMLVCRCMCCSFVVFRAILCSAVF